MMMFSHHGDKNDVDEEEAANDGHVDNVVMNDDEERLKMEYGRSR